jgi:hypothetical protein
MSDEDIIAFLDAFDEHASEEEKGYLEEYRSAPDKIAYLVDISHEASERGSELKTYTFTFDVEENDYLAEICPDGESGFVALHQFCRLFFVQLVEYGEGGDNFGPWRTMKEAEQAFDYTVFMNDPS